MRGIHASALLAFTAMSLTACAEKAPPTDVSSLVPGGNQGRNDADYDADGNYIGPGSQADLLRKAGSDKVFFELDSSALDDLDKDTLRRQAIWLAQYPNVTVTIEGHCDERGTSDYNLALGERRANAAKNFLAASGIAASRMTVVSFGKERPEALGSDEASWARNRRAVTVVVSRR